MSNTPFSKERPYTGLAVSRSTEGSRTPALFLAATVACALALAAAAQGAGRYVEVEYPVWSKYPNALKDHVFYDGH